MKKHLFAAATAILAVSASTAHAATPNPTESAKDTRSAGATPVSLKDVPDFKPTPEQKKALETRKVWFRDARFGMFIHWGPYALTPMGEASSARGLTMHDEEFEKLPARFNPVEFKPDEWVSLAKAAGMKYIVLTSMHADGFCMWDSKYESYSIMNTPYKRDIVKEFADACRRQDMPFGLYYSILNWHHPLSAVKGRVFLDKDGKRVFAEPSGRVRGYAKLTHVPNPGADIPAYADHCAAQITELVKNYGPLTTLWADVPYNAITGKEGKKLVDLTRSLQPDILINDRFYGPSDYRTPEQKTGAFDNAKLWESCMCMGGCWSHIPDDAIKTPRQCLHMLLDCAGGGGNMLLDVGPDALGRIDAKEVANLRQLGEWTKKYGESVYGTLGGPFKPWALGGSTCKEKTVYLHIRHWVGDSFRLPPIPAKINKASVLTGGEVVWTQDDQGLSFRMDEKSRHPWDTVIALELDRPASEVPPVEVGEGFAPTPLPVTNGPVNAKGQVLKSPSHDAPHGHMVALGDAKESRWLETGLGAPHPVSAALVTEGVGKNGCRIRAFEVQYEADGTWKTCATGGSPEGTMLLSFPEVTARKFRLLVTDADKDPFVLKFDLFHAPWGQAGGK